MTEYQKKLMENMDNETLLDNYRYFVLKVKDDLDFDCLKFLDAIHEEIIKRMS